MWMERGDRGCRRLSAWGDPCPCSVWTAGGRPCLALCPSSRDPHEDGKQLARRGVPAPLPTRSRTIDTAWSRRSSGRRSHAPHPVSQSRPVARIDRAAGPDTPGTARGRPPGPRRRHHRFLRLRWVRCSRHSPAGRPSPERSGVHRSRTAVESAPLLPTSLGPLNLVAFIPRSNLSTDSGQLDFRSRGLNGLDGCGVYRDTVSSSHSALTMRQAPRRLGQDRRQRLNPCPVADVAVRCCTQR